MVLVLLILVSTFRFSNMTPGLVRYAESHFCKRPRWHPGSSYHRRWQHFWGSLTSLFCAGHHDLNSLAHYCQIQRNISIVMSVNMRFKHITYVIGGIFSLIQHNCSVTTLTLKSFSISVSSLSTMSLRFLEERVSYPVMPNSMRWNKTSQRNKFIERRWRQGIREHLHVVIITMECS